MNDDTASVEGFGMMIVLIFGLIFRASGHTRGESQEGRVGGSVNADKLRHYDYFHKAGAKFFLNEVVENLTSR